MFSTMVDVVRKAIMRLLLLIVIFALTSFPCSAQTPSASALFPIEIKSKHGYIDSSGKIVIRPQFDDAWRFSEGLAPVLVSDKWGFIDKTGTIVIAPQFFSVMPFQEGLAVVGAFFKSGPINDSVGNYGYIDHTGRFAIAPQFGVASDFSNGLARIQTEDYKNGYIGKSGKVVFWEKRVSEDFSDNLALFKTNSNMPGS
ncbi:MAG TPA: WG repeat-containing protein, partial [Pyrinomonadaceae bacterium]|nr:WG repeat-containing protein [Pyrinomonadaceae bacterium]